MHFCRAKIALGNDIRNMMTRSEYSPVSWPEIAVLRLMHGEGSIEDIKPFVSVPQKARDERARLMLIYGEAPLKEIWGGMNAPSELELPEAELEADIVWFNPLTQRAERTGKDGKGSEPLPPQAPSSDDPIEARPAVEVVGQPMAGPRQAEANDPYSEYEQPFG